MASSKTKSFFNSNDLSRVFLSGIDICITESGLIVYISWKQGIKSRWLFLSDNSEKIRTVVANETSHVGKALPCPIMISNAWSHASYSSMPRAILEKSREAWTPGCWP